MAGPWTNFKVDVYRRNGVFIASTNKVLDAKVESELDTIGKGTIHVPLNETPAQSLFVKNRVCVISVEHGGNAHPIVMGQFVIQKVRKIINSNGAEVLEVAGADLLVEFTYPNMGYTVISDGAGGPSADALQDVFDIYAATSVVNWSYSALGSGSDNAYIVGSGESVWDAILTITKANGGHVSLGHRAPGIQNGNETYPHYMLNFWWSHGFTGGWPLAFDALTLNNNLAGSNRPVLDFDFTEETAETVTRVYVYGAGMGEEKFTIADRTDGSDPIGFTSYPSNSLVVNNTLEAVIDQPQITRVLNLSNIKPEDPDNETERESAANVLLAGAIQYLQEHDGSTRTYYKIKTTVRGDHTVGQLVRLTHTHESYIDALGNPTTTPTNIIDVDDDFILIKYDLTYGPDGILYADLLLGEIPKAKTDGQRLVAEKIKSLQTAIDNANAGQVGGSSGGGSNPSNALLADGSVTLAGDMQVNAGVRIDGTDISQLKISDFVLMAASAEANRGRVLRDGDGIAIVDGGAGGNVTVGVLLDALAGLVFDNGELAMGTPSELSASSANAVTAVSHSHAVVASNNPGAAESLLKTGSDGRVILENIEVKTLSSSVRLNVNKLVLTDRDSGIAYNLYLRDKHLLIEPV